MLTYRKRRTRRAVRNIAGGKSDLSSIAMHRVYDSYGNMTSQTNPSAGLGVAAVDCIFGYTGRPFSTPTGLQNNLNRWFDPSVGTWLSEDPAAADENLYRYAGNAPTDGTDPRGERSERMAGQEAAAMVELALTNADKWAKANGETSTTLTFESQLPKAKKEGTGGEGFSVPMPPLWFDVPHEGLNTPNMPGYSVEQISKAIVSVQGKIPSGQNQGKNGIILRNVAVLQLKGHGRLALMGINVGQGDPCEVNRGTDPNVDNWQSFFVDRRNAVAFANTLRAVTFFVRPSGSRPLVILMACNLGISTYLDRPGRANAKSVPQIVADQLDVDVISPGGFSKISGFNGPEGQVEAPTVSATDWEVGWEGNKHPTFFQKLEQLANETNVSTEQVAARKAVQEFKDANVFDKEHDSKNNSFFYTTPNP